MQSPFFMKFYLHFCVKKRYRHEFRTDALYNEINFVLGVFAAPFLAIYQVSLFGRIIHNERILIY